MVRTPGRIAENLIARRGAMHCAPLQCGLEATGRRLPHGHEIILDLALPVHKLIDDPTDLPIGFAAHFPPT